MAATYTIMIGAFSYEMRATSYHGEHLLPVTPLQQLISYYVMSFGHYGIANSHKGKLVDNVATCMKRCIISSQQSDHKTNEISM